MTEFKTFHSPHADRECPPICCLPPTEPLPPPHRWGEGNRLVPICLHERAPTAFRAVSLGAVVGPLKTILPKTLQLISGTGCRFFFWVRQPLSISVRLPGDHPWGLKKVWHLKSNLDCKRHGFPSPFFWWGGVVSPALPGSGCPPGDWGHTAAPRQVRAQRSSSWKWHPFIPRNASNRKVNC